MSGRILQVIAASVREDIGLRNGTKDPKVRAYYNGKIAAFFLVLEELGELSIMRNLQQEALL